MTKETKDILNKAITDVGYWQWWDEQEGDYMVEFGGVLLYDDTRRGKTPRSSAIALGFYENAFLIFLDNDTQPKWYELLHNDAIDPFTMDQESLVFDDKEHALNLLKQYKKHHGAFDSMDEAIASIKNAKEILTGTSGDFGFIIGGDHLQLHGRKEEYTDEDIKILSEKWWEYWKDYWKKRGTKDAYKEDYACEVTIPYK